MIHLSNKIRDYFYCYQPNQILNKRLKKIFNYPISYIIISNLYDELKKLDKYKFIDKLCIAQKLNNNLVKDSCISFAYKLQNHK